MDIGGTKQNIYRWKGFDESYSKVLFFFNLSHCVKSYAHLCQFYQTTHQISDPGLRLNKNFILPNFVLHFE